MVWLLIFVVSWRFPNSKDRESHCSGFEAVSVITRRPIALESQWIIRCRKYSKSASYDVFIDSLS